MAVPPLLVLVLVPLRGGTGTQEDVGVLGTAELRVRGASSTLLAVLPPLAVLAGLLPFSI